MFGFNASRKGQADTQLWKRSLRFAPQNDFRLTIFIQAQRPGHARTDVIQPITAYSRVSLSSHDDQDSQQEGGRPQVRQYSGGSRSRKKCYYQPKQSGRGNHEGTVTDSRILCTASWA